MVYTCIHRRYLRYSDNFNGNLVTLFFNLYIDLPVLVGDPLLPDLAGGNNSLQFYHVRTGHPPEIVIYKNHCRHVLLPAGPARYPGLPEGTIVPGRYEPCEKELGSSS